MSFSVGPASLGTLVAKQKKGDERRTGVLKTTLSENTNLEPWVNMDV